MIRRLCLAALVSCALPLAAMAQVGAPQGRYIVVLNAGLGMPGDVAADVAQRTGGQVGYVYEHALKGFSITMPRAAVAGVRNDRRVAYVEEDQPVSISAETLPTGVDRIFNPATNDPVATSGSAIDSALSINSADDKRVDADVAVIDTGIDSTHPDLNVVGGTNCLQYSGKGPVWARSYYCDDNASYQDDNDHGTHVSGTIGALDNGIGVVGVAPGVRLWAVKVLDASGSGYDSTVVAGIDWVDQHASTIDVANMSLGGSGRSQAEMDAIDQAVTDGVVIVVAAGNNNDDANNYSPAYVPNAITVSALADFDGKSGGLGSPTCRSDVDDTLAAFSNWGSAVDIAAPGVCILSTLPNNSYGTYSGTSMASPHVAGAAALLASVNHPQNGTDVQDIRDALVAAGNKNWVDRDTADGVPDEPLLDVSTFKPVFVSASGGGGSGGSTTLSASFTHAACTAGQPCQFTDTSTDQGGSIKSWAWDFNGNGQIDSTAQNPTYIYGVGGSFPVKLTVSDGSLTDSTTQSVTVASAGGSAGKNIYVAGIAFQQKGPNLDTTVTIKWDSNGNSSADAGDSPVAGAVLTVKMCGGGACYFTTSAATTDSSGQATYKLMHIASTTYTFTVTSVVLSGYTYDSALDQGNPASYP